MQRRASLQMVLSLLGPLLALGGVLVHLWDWLQALVLIVMEADAAGAQGGAHVEAGQAGAVASTGGVGASTERCSQARAQPQPDAEFGPGASAIAAAVPALASDHEAAAAAAVEGALASDAEADANAVPDAQADAVQQQLCPAEHGTASQMACEHLQGLQTERCSKARRDCAAHSLHHTGCRAGGARKQHACAVGCQACHANA